MQNISQVSFFFFLSIFTWHNTQLSSDNDRRKVCLCLCACMYMQMHKMSRPGRIFPRNLTLHLCKYLTECKVQWNEKQNDQRHVIYTLNPFSSAARQKKFSQIHFPQTHLSYGQSVRLNVVDMQKHALLYRACRYYVHFPDLILPSESSFWSQQSLYTSYAWKMEMWWWGWFYI